MNVKKIILIFAIAFLFAITVLLGGHILRDKPGSLDIIRNQGDGKEVDVVFKKDNLNPPSWIPKNVGADSPWNHSIYLARSKDGKTFTGEELFVQHAGVPDLLYTKDGKIVAVFQYFSYEYEELFDRIVYTISEDSGKTWSKVKQIRLESEYSKGPTPVDPTLVQLNDGRYRLYFTYHKRGSSNPALFSSVSKTIDGVFKDEGMQLSTNGMLLDPAIVFYKNKWHHYTPNHNGSGTIHSVSDNGLDFKLQKNIQSDFQFLGGAIEDNGKLMFYGTKRGVVLAESSDGYSFSEIQSNVVNGADPGIAKLSDRDYLIVYSR